MDEAAVLVKHREVRFPAQAIIQSEFSGHFPDVGTIKRYVLSSLVLITVRAHLEHGRNSGEKVRHGCACGLTTEGYAAVVERIAIRVQVPKRCVCADGGLVIAANQIEIVGNSEDGVSSRTG